MTENRMAWKSDNQGDKKETFIQTSRRGGDGQPGQRGLVQGRSCQTHEVEDCGAGQAVQPHIRA